ncbi:MAG: hypothetical protein KDN22_12635 [Verrucomicrobiae bacterium]|nr:hypothetical protein [Verrucomicrobiae bacterium]
MNSSTAKVFHAGLWILLGAAIGTAVGRAAFQPRIPIETDTNVVRPTVASAIELGSEGDLYARLAPAATPTIDAVRGLFAEAKTSRVPLRIQQELQRMLRELARNADNAPELLRLIVHDNTILSDATVSVFFEEWDASDHSSALSAIEKLPTWALRQAALAGLTKSWAKSDPGAAIDYFKSLPRSRPREIGLWRVTLAIAKDDPQRALDLARELRIGWIEDAVYDSVAGSLDYDAAVDWIRKIDSPTLRRDLHSRALTRLADKDIDRGIEEILKLKDANMRADNLRTKLGQLALSDGKMAAKYLATLPPEAIPDGVLFRAGSNMALRKYEDAMAAGTTLPEDRRSEFFAGVLATIRPGDSLSPGEFATRIDTSVTPGQRRNDLYENTARAWHQKDPQATASWLAELPASDERDHAIHAFATVLSETDPEGALHWANGISSSGLRESAIDEVNSKTAEKVGLDNGAH